MRLIFIVALLVGCASAPVPQEPPLDATPSATHHAVRPEPSFAAKRLGAESGALVVREVRFLGGETEVGPLALHELSEIPLETKRAQVIAWADAPYGEGDRKLAEARANAICGKLAPLKCETYNMAQKAGLFSRALSMHTARVKVAAAAAAPAEGSRAIVLFFK